MNIIINTSLMVPIYEQIVDQIKKLIRNGELKENDNLPSVRTLSKELKISALTVKKAYDNLESEGFTVTVHGKGTYVAATNGSVRGGNCFWKNRKKNWKRIWSRLSKKADDVVLVMKI